MRTALHDIHTNWLYLSDYNTYHVNIRLQYASGCRIYINIGIFTNNKIIKALLYITNK